MIRKVRTAIVMIIITAAVIIAIFVPYKRYMAGQVRNESGVHLEEVFYQVNTTFSNVVSDNWRILNTWKAYVEEISRDSRGAAVLADYMAQQKDTWGFTDFYFLDKDGKYLTLDGQEGYFDLGSGLFSLMNDGEDVVVSSTLSTGVPVFLFAAPMEPGSFRDFNYRAIAISYNQSAITSLLKISAFGHEAECYIISPNGAIEMATQDGGNGGIYNYFAYLLENARFHWGTMDGLRSDIGGGQKGIAEYAVDGVDYYLSYQPVGIEDWTLLGVVPKNTVNANMNSLQHVTMTVFAVLFLVLSLMVLSMVIRRNRSIVRGKDIELKYRDQLFDLLTNNVDDVFVMFSAGQKSAEYVSPNVERLLGISEAQVRLDVGILETTLVEGPPVLTGLNDLAMGQIRRRDDYRINICTGERRWYCTMLYHEVVDGSEKFILILSDRTNEKKNDERLLQALDVAENANAAKSTFFSNMSHDIRTPLNGIIGMTTIAQANVDQRETVEDCLRKISGSSRHLLELINDILDMSKIESGKITLNYEQFDIGALVDEVMEIIRPQAAAKAQKLELSIRGDHRELMGDTLRLNQVLLNILSNAVKYTGNGGRIQVEVTDGAKAPAGYAGYRFRVRDNGQGMTEEFVATIFEPFSRERNSTISKIQGTGLGMSICKGIVDLMGGIIQVESAPGQGSTFTVELPLRIADAADMDRQVQAQSVAAFDYKGKLFLVVEDNELNAEIMCRLLELEGAQTRQAWNGREALELFAASAPGTFDAILMDVQMPVMNGYESTRAIRSAQHPDAARIPIIAMTADAFAEDVQRARDAGMNAHVSKPVDMGTLSAVLAEVCGVSDNANDQ